jgi:hypothetical protein
VVGDVEAANRVLVQEFGPVGVRVDRRRVAPAAAWLMTLLVASVAFAVSVGVPVTVGNAIYQRPPALTVLNVGGNEYVITSCGAGSVA